MKSSCTVVVVLLISMVTAGCAQNRHLAATQRENAALKSRVATLELEVAELKQQRTPLTVNGLTLSALEPLTELKLTPSLRKPAERDATVQGQGQLVLGSTAPVFHATTISAGRGSIGVIQLAPATTRTTTTTPTKPATTTTTQLIIPATPAKLRQIAR